MVQLMVLLEHLMVTTTAGDCAGVLGQVILSGDKPFTVTPGNAANSFQQIQTLFHHL